MFEGYNKKPNKKSKKSQITIFMLIGIFVLLILVLLYSLIGTKQEKVILDYKQVDEVRFYVNNELEKALDNALFLLSQQGGLIFKFQSGLVDKEDYKGRDYELNLNNKRINIFIPYRIENYNPLITAAAPNYPCFNNNPNCDFIHSNKDFLVGYYKPLIVNPEEQIESYVERQISNIDLSRFEQEYGFDFKLTNPKARVVIGESSVTVDLDFNITIIKHSNKDGKDIIFNINNFKARSSVRLKDILELAEYIMDNEVKDITFDPKKDKGVTKKITDGFIVKKRKLQNNDFLVTILDSKSYLTHIKNKDNNFVFQFLIENRPPALDNIIVNNPISLQSKSSSQSKSYRIEALGFDPDEEPVSYKIEELSSNNPSNSYKIISCKNPVTNVDEKRCFEINNLQSGRTYKFNIIVEDPEGNKDWQEIKISVS